MIPTNYQPIPTENTNSVYNSRNYLLPQEDTGLEGKRGGKCLVLSEIFYFGEKILAMIRHVFQPCVAYSEIEKS